MKEIESLVAHLPPPTISPPLPCDEQGEILHSGPLACQQNYQDYTDEQQETWRLLFTKQQENLREIAYSVWLTAIDTIGLCSSQIPYLSDITQKLYPLTQWQPVPISGFLPAKDYFWFLAQRQFPTVTTIRRRDQLEFCVEPDVFHDAFGHLPMHSHPAFAHFLELFGKTALATETEQGMIEMQRLYWFTVEYGMIWEDGRLKVSGSGHMSGIKEARYSLTDKVKKIPFDLKRVTQQEFNPHVLQDTLFVLDSYDQLYVAMKEKAEELGVL